MIKAVNTTAFFVVTVKIAIFSPYSYSMGRTLASRYRREPMKLFVDTANLKDIEEALKRGFVQGVTTNPSLLAKEPKANFEEHMKKIVELIKRYNPNAHLSVEVVSRDPGEILQQAKHFKKTFELESLSIKVHIGWDELTVIRELSKEEISVNCTACMKLTQAVMAANAGAEYVSFFYRRIKDASPEVMEERLLSCIEFFKESKHEITKKELLEKLDWCRGHIGKAVEAMEKTALDEEDFDPCKIIREFRRLLDANNLPTKIIAGSMRGAVDVRNALQAGAHIVTVPPKFFPDMVNHFKTDEVIAAFLRDFKHWQS